MFFANYVKDIPLSECADNDGHNTDTIDALTLTIPITVFLSKYNQTNSRDQCTCLDQCHQVSQSDRHKLILDILHTTRRSSRRMDLIALLYSDLLSSVLQGTPLQQAVQDTAEKMYGSTFSMLEQVSKSKTDPMVACYIDSSFPALLHFAFKYSGAKIDSAESGLLTSANAGGENVARGAALGALLGASYGYIDGIPLWMKEGLINTCDIHVDIEKAVTDSERGGVLDGGAAADCAGTAVEKAVNAADLEY